MVAVHPNRYFHELIEQSGLFALNIITKEHKELLSHFKGPVPDEKFESVSWESGITGCPILTDGIGCLECRVTQKLSPGNHTLFIGEVVNAVFHKEGVPFSTADYEGCYLGKS